MEQLVHRAVDPARDGLALAVSELASWPARRWLVAFLVAVAVGLLTGVPTDVVPTSLYRRMLPVTWWDYPIWAGSAILFGLVAGTFVRVGAHAPGVDRAGRTAGGGILAYLAVGCPICNKLVVAAIGVSGALTYFAPIQPFLGLLSIVLLAATVIVRLRGLAACPTSRA